MAFQLLLGIQNASTPPHPPHTPPFPSISLSLALFAMELKDYSLWGTGGVDVVYPVNFRDLGPRGKALPGQTPDRRGDGHVTSRPLLGCPMTDNIEFPERPTAVDQKHS